MPPFDAVTPPALPRTSRPWRDLLYLQVLVAIVIGATIGWIWPDVGESLKPLGDIFVKAVRMMIAPVVFCTIAPGIAGIGSEKGLGRVLVKTMGLFYAMAAIALLFGLAAVTLTAPGAGMNVNVAELDPPAYARSHGGTPAGGKEFFLHIVPDSFLGAFTEGHVLPVLFLAILVGIGISRTGQAGRAVAGAIESVGTVIFSGFDVIMRFAPLGAAGAMAFTVGKYGLHSIASLGKLILTFYVACGLFLLLVPGLLAVAHGFSFWRVLRYFREEFLIVLGTASTEPILPQLIQKLERLGCKRSLAGIIVPLGYSFNLDGIAIYLTLASLFIAQACNIHLAPGQIATMLLLMLVTSKGGAGVTGSGFVVLVSTLSVLPDIPVAGVALLVSIDRFMSEARALTSAISNTVACIVVCLWEGACDRKTLEEQLRANGVRTPVFAAKSSAASAGEP